MLERDLLLKGYRGLLSTDNNYCYIMCIYGIQTFCILLFIKEIKIGGKENLTLIPYSFHLISHREEQLEQCI